MISYVGCKFSKKWAQNAEIRIYFSLKCFYQTCNFQRWSHYNVPLFFMPLGAFLVTFTEIQKLGERTKICLMSFHIEFPYTITVSMHELHSHFLLSELIKK